MPLRCPSFPEPPLAMLCQWCTDARAIQATCQACPGKANRQHNWVQWHVIILEGQNGEDGDAAWDSLLPVLPCVGCVFLPLVGEVEVPECVDLLGQIRIWIPTKNYEETSINQNLGRQEVVYAQCSLCVSNALSLWFPSSRPPSLWETREE